MALSNYVRSGKDKDAISAVVLASSRGGKLVHAGTTSEGFTLGDSRELSKRVGLLPPGEVPDNWNSNAFPEVVWLPAAARLRLIVDHAGVSQDGAINNPSYRRLKD